MNKQRYLAELRRLLVFMTEEDRDRTVRYYADLFDGAGPEGEQALIAGLGTPTKTAIRLSRGYEPGSIPAMGPPPPPDAPYAPDPPPAEDPPSAPDPPSAEDAPPAEDDEYWSELLGFDVPELSAPAEEPEFLESRSRARAASGPVRPSGPGTALFVLLLIVPGIPAAALFLLAMAVCAAPGCALLFGAYLSAVGGLWCLAHTADAILMFGLAFLVLGLGIFVLGLGIGLDVKLVRVYARGVGRAAGRFLGREMTDDETR